MDFEKMMETQRQYDELRKQGIVVNEWLSPELNKQYSHRGPINIDGDEEGARLERVPGREPSNPWVAPETMAKARKDAEGDKLPGWMEKGVNWGAKKAADIDVLDLFGELF